MSSPFKWSSASVSLAGNVRDVNEDACLDESEHGLWVVADGMGGHEAGDVASRMIVDALGEVDSQGRLSSLLDDVEDRLVEVNSRIYHGGTMRATPVTMGSTVAALLANGHHCLSLWAGDSRVYRYRNKELEQITRDHSQTEKLIQEGKLRREAAEGHPDAHVITRAVGGGPRLFLDSELKRIRDGDRYLLCSDGLNKELDDSEIGEGLGVGNCAAACSHLVNLALKRRCVDNVTAIVVQFDETRQWN